LGGAVGRKAEEDDFLGRSTWTWLLFAAYLNLNNSVENPILKQ